MNIKKNKRILLLLSLCLFVFPVLAFAAANLNYTPMEKIPGLTTNSGNFVTYVLAIYKFGIWTIGIAALLMIMIGGFMYIASAGNNASMEKAKGIIYDSVIGILMALTAWLLLYVINPELVKIKEVSLSGTAANISFCVKWCEDAQGNADWTSQCKAGCESGHGTTVAATGTCNDLNASLKGELANANNGVPPALLASFLLRECSPAMSNPSACPTDHGGTGNDKDVGGPMQFKTTTWNSLGCSGSKFNRQDALACAAKKINNDSGGDYSDAGVRKAASLYCSNSASACSSMSTAMCGLDYCGGIMSNYNVYKNCAW
jgi:hypothetical protein